MRIFFKTDLYSRLKKLVIFVFIIDALFWLSINNFLGFAGSTSISTLLAYISIYILFKILFEKLNKKEILSLPLSYKFWILICFFGVLIGIFFSENYWDLKYVFVSGIPLVFVSLVLILGIRLHYFKFIIDFYLKNVVLISLFFIPLIYIANQEIFSRLVVSLSFFVVLIPYFKKNRVFLILLLSAISILLVIGFRTNVLKFSISFIILGFYYLRNYGFNKLFKVSFYTLFFAPVILLYLAINNNYNVLEELSSGDKIIVKNNRGNEENLLKDTRTILYNDVINNVMSSNSFLFGKGLSGSYQTYIFDDKGGTINNQRYRCEVHFLNIFLYFGFVGVISYATLLFSVCYQGIYNSKNILAKMLSLVIASRFLLSFVEEFSQYDSNFFFFWLIVGSVSSPQLRSMSDQQLKSFFK